MFVIAAATVLVYGNTFDASFHFDDIQSIVQNESLRDLRRQWPPSGTRYLGYLSFALNYAIGGLEVSGYHLANILIHLCSGLLVFWLTAITLRTPVLSRARMGPLMGKYLPLASGLLFAVHPIQTEAVTYVVQRFTSLATLFYLLSLALYAQGRLLLEVNRPPKVRVAALYCLSFGAAVAAMKTKEISFTLPLVAAGYELLFFGIRRRLLLLAPLATTVAIVPLSLPPVQNLADVLDDAGHLAAETEDVTRQVYLLTQSRVVVTYLRLLVVPVRQNLDYDFPLSDSLADPRVLLALAVLLAVAAFASLGLIRAHRTNHAAGILVFFGIAWFFVTLSVESSVIPIRDVIFEHRMYLPSVGAAVGLATALLWVVENLRLHVPLALQATGALLVSAGPLGAATCARNLIWRDDVTLWSDVVAKSPEKARPHNNLGAAYEARGRLEDATREYSVALRIRSRLATMKIRTPTPEVHGLGNPHQTTDEVRGEGREHGDAALDGSSADGHYNSGLSHVVNGRLDDAMREFRVALKIRPRFPEAHNNLGAIYQAKGQIDQATREYGEAVRLAPGLADAHVNLGLVHQVKGRVEDAIREYREAIRLAPGLAMAHNNLGNAYREKGQIDDAVREYREAVRLDPSLPDPHNNLGTILQAKGQLDDAVREYREAIRLAPGLADPHGNLADVYKAKGQFDEGAREQREAIRLGTETSARRGRRSSHP